MSAVATARVPTEKGSRYLQQLCKHFAHKLPVKFNEHAGSISFSIGECAMTANAEALTIIATAPIEGDMDQLKDVIVRHLVRFAFREELQVEWQLTVAS